MTGSEEEVIAFPVVLAAPRTFHLFCRDESDGWDLTYQDINASSYDALKLKRVSFYLDVGLVSPMGFGFDGSIMIPRTPDLRSADDAVDAFNRALATCLLGGLPGEQVTSKELGLGNLLSTGYFRYAKAHGAVPALHQAMGERAAGNYLTMQLLDPPRILRKDVEEAYRIGRPVIEVLRTVNAATLLMAFSFHAATEYRNSLIYSWVVIEQLIGQLWEEVYMKDPALLRFEERLGTLRATARLVSARIEFLTQAGLIDRKLYSYLARARNGRNDFIHKGLSPDHRTSYFSLIALARLVELLCSAAGVPFQASELTKLVANRSRGGFREGVVAKAEDVDWAQPSLWRPLAPLPGEKHWEGEYETFRDIQLQPVPSVP